MLLEYSDRPTTSSSSDSYNNRMKRFLFITAEIHSVLRKLLKSCFIQTSIQLQGDRQGLSHPSTLQMNEAKQRVEGICIRPPCQAGMKSDFWTRTLHRGSWQAAGQKIAVPSASRALPTPSEMPAAEFNNPTKEEKLLPLVFWQSGTGFPSMPI